MYAAFVYCGNEIEVQQRRIRMYDTCFMLMLKGNAMSAIIYIYKMRIHLDWE